MIHLCNLKLGIWYFSSNHISKQCNRICKLETRFCSDFGQQSKSLWKCTGWMTSLLPWPRILTVTDKKLFVYTIRYEPPIKSLQYLVAKSPYHAYYMITFLWVSRKSFGKKVLRFVNYKCFFKVMPVTQTLDWPYLRNDWYAWREPKRNCIGCRLDKDSIR